jgi:hypothetical protein
MMQYEYWLSTVGLVHSATKHLQLRGWKGSISIIYLILLDRTYITLGDRMVSE